MPKRASQTPQTEYQVLEARIAALEQSVRRLSSAGRSTFLTSDQSKHLDPVQGEVIVNHPGVHPESSGTTGVSYYHDGAWRALSTGGFPTAVIMEGGTIAPSSGDQIPVRGDPLLSYILNDLPAPNNYFSFEETDEGDTGNFGHELRAHQPGMMLLHAVTGWDETTTDATEDFSAAFFYLNPYKGPNYTNLWDASFTASADWNRSYTGSYQGIFEMWADPWLRITGLFMNPGDIWFRPTAQQYTGGDRGVSLRLFWAVYLAPLLVGDPNQI